MSQAARTSRLPTGTVTFLFTDIEGSTRRWEHQPQQMKHALQRHDTIVRRAIEGNGGYVFKTVGDAFCAAFASAPHALQAALQAQLALDKGPGSGVPSPESADDDSGLGTPDPGLILRVRMALHTGTAEEWDGDYFGQPVNRVARLLSTGHGGQVLLSQPTYELVRDDLPPGSQLLDFGERRLKDLIRPEHVYQLSITGLPSEFPPLKTLDARYNNLPVQPTPLVGREKELAAISTLLRTPTVRLATLTGPGGTGKTRFGLQIAADMLDEFEDGVIFVNLAPLTDHRLVVSTVAQSLAVQETAGEPLIETLKNYLREKEILLLLDNFEQVAKAAKEVGELLANAPRLKVLITSRVPLRIRGEKEYPVPPLSLPDPTHLPPLERLTQYEAVRLFIERATDIKPDFEVTNENAPAVAEICVRLDGLPLAIELAAARIRLLPPQAMLSRLESRLKLLTGGAKDLPARQQTLRNAIEWSYDLLDEEEARLFRRLAVFVGGRTLEAVEAVCNAEGDLGMDVLDGVESLVSKSLLRQEEGVGGEPRFVMLETIHEYAREKLEESGEAEALRRRHAEYFAALAGEAKLHMYGPNQQYLMRRVDDEHDNFRAAMQWSVERGDVEHGAKIAGALERFWDLRGRWSEARRWLGAFLVHEDRLSSDTRAKIYKSAANEGGVSGRSPQQLFEGALALHRAEGNLTDAAAILNNLGNFWRRRDPDRAEAYLLESLKIYDELGIRFEKRRPFANLADIAEGRGDYSRAEALTREALALAEEQGDLLGIGLFRGRLGCILILSGDRTRGLSLIEEGLDFARESGNEGSLIVRLTAAGEACRLAGDYSLARRFYAEGLERVPRDDQRWYPTLLSNFGYVLLYDQDLEGAAHHFRESLGTFGIKRLSDDDDVALALAGLGGVAAVRGQGTRAARLFGGAEAVLQASALSLAPVDRREFDRYSSIARPLLTEEEWEQAWQEGQAMSIQQAIEYALEESTVE